MVMFCLILQTNDGGGGGGGGGGGVGLGGISLHEFFFRPLIVNFFCG